MQIKQMAFFAGLLFASSATLAQMPVPILNDANLPPKSSPQVEASKKLESLLKCSKSASSTLTAETVKGLFQELGLVKGIDDFYFPTAKNPHPSLFGDVILSAFFKYSAFNDKSITVYLKNQTGKQMAKKLGVTEINEYATTDEVSYFKKVSNKTYLHVVSVDSLDLSDNSSLKFQSAVSCQVIK